MAGPELKSSKSVSACIDVCDVDHTNDSESRERSLSSFV